MPGRLKCGEAEVFGRLKRRESGSVEEAEAVPVLRTENRAFLAFLTNRAGFCIMNRDSGGGQAVGWRPEREKET